MTNCIFCWDVAEAPCSCIRTLTIVGWEKTPQVGSLLPVGQGSIADRHTPNDKTDTRNSRMSVKVIIT